MRRKEKQTSTAVALGVFDTCTYATLSLSAKDKPYAVPLSVVRIGSQLFFHCATIGAKSDIIAINNAACISAVSYTKLMPNNFSVNYLSAIAHGTIKEVTDYDAKYLALMAIASKFALPNIQNADTYITQSINKTAVFQMDIISISGKGFNYAI